ncbi:Vacuolar protein sorting-associated protein 20 [Exophiala xenobiotica]|uniref:Vacuolar protein sorting-associated protein 20 n=1 Tax=Lithohypha guttulata TaxID=1690604 RepID=A0ABR0KEZ2_9EURO|nr:Vacuolar protein sorting-associated protein 20 [Lithohypha guttulata]KAK5322181.1 Vacuolar protein sorting-associated protein 20 [Exophiala xenobiotica]
MGNSGSKISAQDRAILDMKNQRDKLRQYQKKVTVITNREKEIARECLAKGEKEKALLALRRKKYQESLLSQTDAQLEQLEKLTSNVEFALVQKDVVFGLQRGTEVLTMINKEMGGLASVEKIMEDSAEARREQEEISEALAGQLSNQEEDDVEDELEALEREVEDVKLPDAPSKAIITDGDLPNAPETELGREQKRKERARQRRAQLEAA